MRERERKKQQELETAKEEQLRSEVLARKKQDNIKTLGKTKEEIQQVEEQMIQLKNKKHQLFLQLKALITKEVEMEKIRKES
jgi:G protein pathway suppressor 2